MPSKLPPKLIAHQTCNICGRNFEEVGIGRSSFRETVREVRMKASRQLSLNPERVYQPEDINYAFSVVPVDVLKRRNMQTNYEVRCRDCIQKKAITIKNHLLKNTKKSFEGELLPIKLCGYTIKEEIIHAILDFLELPYDLVKFTSISRACYRFVHSSDYTWNTHIDLYGDEKNVGRLLQYFFKSYKYDPSFSFSAVASINYREPRYYSIRYGGAILKDTNDAYADQKKLVKLHKTNFCNDFVMALITDCLPKRSIKQVHIGSFAYATAMGFQFLLDKAKLITSIKTESRQQSLVCVRFLAETQRHRLSIVSSIHINQLSEKTSFKYSDKILSYPGRVVLGSIGRCLNLRNLSITNTRLDLNIKTYNLGGSFSALESVSMESLSMMNTNVKKLNLRNTYCNNLIGLLMLYPSVEDLYLNINYDLPTFKSKKTNIFDVLSQLYYKTLTHITLSVPEQQVDIKLFLAKCYNLESLVIVGPVQESMIEETTENRYITNEKRLIKELLQMQIEHIQPNRRFEKLVLQNAYLPPNVHYWKQISTMIPTMKHLQTNMLLSNDAMTDILDYFNDIENLIIPRTRAILNSLAKLPKLKTLVNHTTLDPTNFPKLSIALAKSGAPLERLDLRNVALDEPTLLDLLNQLQTTLKTIICRSIIRGPKWRERFGNVYTGEINLDILSQAYPEIHIIIVNEDELIPSVLPMNDESREAYMEQWHSMVNSLRDGPSATPQEVDDNEYQEAGGMIPPTDDTVSVAPLDSPPKNTKRSLKKSLSNSRSIRKREMAYMRQSKLLEGFAKSIKQENKIIASLEDLRKLKRLERQKRVEEKREKKRIAREQRIKEREARRKQTEQQQQQTPHLEDTMKDPYPNVRHERDQQIRKEKRQQLRQSQIIRNQQLEQKQLEKLENRPLKPDVEGVSEENLLDEDDVLTNEEPQKLLSPELTPNEPAAPEEKNPLVISTNRTKPTPEPIIEYNLDTLPVSEHLDPTTNLPKKLPPPLELSSTTSLENHIDNTIQGLVEGKSSTNTPAASPTVNISLNDIDNLISKRFKSLKDDLLSSITPSTPLPTPPASKPLSPPKESLSEPSKNALVEKRGLFETDKVDVSSTRINLAQEPSYQFWKFAVQKKTQTFREERKQRARTLFHQAVDLHEREKEEQLGNDVSKVVQDTLESVHSLKSSSDITPSAEEVGFRFKLNMINQRLKRIKEIKTSVYMENREPTMEEQKVLLSEPKYIKSKFSIEMKLGRSRANSKALLIKQSTNPTLLKPLPSKHTLSPISEIDDSHRKEYERASNMHHMRHVIRQLSHSKDLHKRVIAHNLQSSPPEMPSTTKRQLPPLHNTHPTTPENTQPSTPEELLSEQPDDLHLSDLEVSRNQPDGHHDSLDYHQPTPLTPPLSPLSHPTHPPPEHGTLPPPSVVHRPPSTTQESSHPLTEDAPSVEQDVPPPSHGPPPPLTDVELATHDINTLLSPEDEEEEHLVVHHHNSLPPLRSPSHMDPLESSGGATINASPPQQQQQVSPSSTPKKVQKNHHKLNHQPSSSNRGFFSFLRLKKKPLRPLDELLADREELLRRLAIIEKIKSRPPPLDEKSKRRLRSEKTYMKELSRIEKELLKHHKSKK